MKRFVLFFLLLTFFVTAASAQFRRSRDRAGSASDNNLNYANPGEYTLAGIEVAGLNVLDKNSMIALTGLKIGDKIKIPSDAISGAIRKLWKLGLVGDVTIKVDRIEGSDVYLILELSERPRLTAFYFTGISKGQESALKEDLSLIRGKIVNDALIRNTENAVRKHFVKKGFLNTDVKIIQERDTLNREGIKLNIEVRPYSKVKINRINIEGNQEVYAGKLKRKLKSTHEHPRLTLHRAIARSLFTKQVWKMGDSATWTDVKTFLNDNVKLNVFAGSKYIKTDYEEDKKKLISFYNSKGHRDAEILFDTVFAHNKKTVDVNIKLTEGPKYYFRNITWKGNYIHNNKTLESILGIKKGDVYNRELLDRKISFDQKTGMDISGLYMDDGYLFFSIRPFERIIEGDSIDVEMRIFEGEQAIVDEVTFTGNQRTSDHVVRRELSTLPGQKFRRSDIIRTQQRLGQLGYFDPAQIGQNIMPNPANGTVDIEWQLQEQSNDQIQLSGGWGGQFGFVGTLGLTFNNFSLRNVPKIKEWRPLPVGDGQRLSVQAQANGRTYQNYSFSFTEPWLGGRKPHSLTVSYSRSFSRSAGLGATSFFDLNSLIKLDNISIGLGRFLEWPDNYFTLNNSLSFSSFNLENINYGLGCSTCSSYAISLITSISRSSIDDPRYPAQGSQISLTTTLTPPYSGFNKKDYTNISDEERNRFQEYHKWMFDAKWYLPLDRKKKLVIEAKAHFGFLGAYNVNKTGIGPFERFYLGGDGLAGGFSSFVLGQEVVGLRGYENNAITPPDYGTGNSTSNVRGGIAYDKFGLELRYPVTTGNTATIYGFAFTEAGNNWGNYKDFNPFKMYRSAGFGARIFMPAFGLIGLNWAYGFDTVPLGGRGVISGSQFHFTIGQQIR
ncbi:outer membrane protein/protective antigen OMA87 [Chryseotalea sanaruensis]|uniref:Outer membrane protein/protective antigen OMA87 n=1 Tax=Chryseotalea sanaruensis TaxID=2482724 RepID=A0A401U8G6_9BACT|nr:POTRA domain-containing protein [Chryseotalea sanaruensis]GCC51183.1 outer membrane protein/protective antigen OMA87 [Chryseotalea sanaruensis]